MTLDLHLMYANNNENNLILAVAKHPYAENISSTPPPLALSWCKLLLPYEDLNTFFVGAVLRSLIPLPRLSSVACWALAGSELGVVGGGGCNYMNNAEESKDHK